MSYNVQNLFDSRPQKGKDEWTFLPRSHPLKSQCATVKSPYRRRQCFETDWTEEKLSLKLNQIKRAIEGEEGHSPDFLALIEVENEEVVARLGKLLGLSKYALTKASDKRGLRVALLWRQSQVVRKLEVKEYSVSPETRAILEVSFKIKAQKITFLVNHWPSLSNDPSLRKRAVQTLSELVSDKEEALVALGDFNLREHSLPLELRGSLVDLSRGKGTYFYAPTNTWHLFDRILVSPSLKKESSQFEIRSGPLLSKRHRGSFRSSVPLRYDFMATNTLQAGFSDHYPVSFKLTL